MTTKLTRRDFLRVAGGSGLLLTVGGLWMMADRSPMIPAQPLSPTQNPHDPRQATGFVNRLRIPADP